MISAGSYHLLNVVKLVSFGAYLDGGESGEILLPKRFMPENISVDMSLEVFIYHDNEGRLIATTQKAKAEVGQVAYLQVKSKMHQGAFLDWGLMKDIFLPISQQVSVIYEGMFLPVYLYIDKLTQRVVATEKFQHLLKQNEIKLNENDVVNLLVTRKTDLGFEVVINDAHIGLIHNSDIFYELKLGTRLKGYIKSLLAEGKIDVMPGERGYKRVESETDKIYRLLEENNGYLPYGDKSKPDEIYDYFGMSKKTFKMALGALLRQKKIQFTQTGFKQITKE